MTTTNGIDISAWNTVTDWNALKKDPKQLKFCFIKASEGNGYRAAYKSQWDGAGSIGLLRANYHFHRGAVGGAAQADYFLSGYTPGELPPVIDFEDMDGLKACGGRAMFENLKATAAQIEHRANRTPIIYTGLWYLQLCWANDPTYDSKWLSQYPAWMADYTKSSPEGSSPLRPSWWDWKIWQWSSSGAVNGIAGRVDLNIFNGDLNALKTWAGQPVTKEITDAEKLNLLWQAHPDLHPLP